MNRSRILLSCAIGMVCVMALPVGHARAATGSAATKSPSKSSTTARKSALPPLAGGETLDFSGWQGMLDRYVVNVAAPDQPVDYRFDYVALFKNPGNAEVLSEVHGQLLGVTPSALGSTARRAWAINTYNFLVVERILTNFVTRQVPLSFMAKGIRQLGLTTVRDIKVDGLGFFEAPITTIDGVAYTLDSFERTFVFDGHALPKVGATLTPAPRTLDPRPHFALANGTLGGALIEPRAFRPESLDAQLDRATRDALANPRHLRRDADLGRLWGSSIFTWYEWDFGGREGVSAFVKRHAPEALRAEIATKADPVVDLTIPWDWNFNMVPHKPTKPSGGKPASGASSDSSGTEKTRTP